MDRGQLGTAVDTGFKLWLKSQRSLEASGHNLCLEGPIEFNQSQFV